MKERYSLVGKSREMMGERVKLDLKHDRLLTYGRISDRSLKTVLRKPRKSVSMDFFLFSLRLGL